MTEAPSCDSKVCTVKPCQGREIPLKGGLTLFKRDASQGIRSVCCFDSQLIKRYLPLKYHRRDTSLVSRVSRQKRLCCTAGSSKPPPSSPPFPKAQHLPSTPLTWHCDTPLADALLLPCLKAAEAKTNLLLQESSWGSLSKFLDKNL